MVYFNIIFATGENGEFSSNDCMPWPKIKEDLEWFKSTTMITSNQNKKNIVIMGRNTFESIDRKPLQGRINIVVTNTSVYSNVIQTTTFAEALSVSHELVENGRAESVYVIGGRNMLEIALSHPNLEYIYSTIVSSNDRSSFKSDQYFNIEEKCQVISQKVINTDKYKLVFTKSIMNNVHPENTYINLCTAILQTGKNQTDRTQVGTITKFNRTVKFDMNKYGFPLFTTKRIFWRGVIEELLFFLSGKTDTKVLEAKNVNIWKGNTSREYLDKYGFRSYPEGEMGPGYPHQWRHFGGQWELGKQLELNTADRSEGIDQITNVIENIKLVKATPDHPMGRRLVVSAWNPVDMPYMVLAPCHYSFSFNVDDNLLHCTVNMRSNDVGCGLSFNVASYALLCYMIANLTGLTPGVLTFNLANAHIYLNHIEQIGEQICRPPRAWPKLEIVGNHSSIDDYKISSFNLLDYNPHPAIKMKMAV